MQTDVSLWPSPLWLRPVSLEIQSHQWCPSPRGTAEWWAPRSRAQTSGMTPGIARATVRWPVTSAPTMQRWPWLSRRPTLCPVWHPACCLFFLSWSQTRAISLDARGRKAESRCNVSTHPAFALFTLVTFFFGMAATLTAWNEVRQTTSVCCHEETEVHGNFLKLALTLTANVSYSAVSVCVVLFP